MLRLESENRCLQLQIHPSKRSKLVVLFKALNIARFIDGMHDGTRSAASLLLVSDRLEELVQVVLLIAEELNLLVALLALNLLALFVSLVDSIDLRLKLGYLVLKLRLLMFKLLDGLLKISLAVLRLQLFAHSESH